MSSGKKLYGTFEGVFLPSILTIFGVIMYLRMGWVVGNAGLVGALTIVTIANLITLLTGFSISATATNMKVKGGGAYYMISRSFGVEAGAAIGIPLYLAQAIGVSFYVTGFAESLHGLIPWVPVNVIGVATLLLIAVLTYLSTDLALKAQFLIFLVIFASLISFFLGKPLPDNAVNQGSQVLESASFWAVFAVFFPAVTGIEAGISMSGDLEKPSRSLPLGTLAAILVSYVVYVVMSFFLYTHADERQLLTNNMVVRDVAAVGALITVGIWGATLSSALGALLGAPRTMQALAEDGVLPKFLSKGYGPSYEPRIATALSFLVALAGVVMGDLNAIAPVLSMFFLTSYGALNLAAGMEGLLGNPAWRPSFRPPWILSLAGAGLCFWAMLMIDAGATFLAGASIAMIYYLMHKRNLRARWTDLRRGILMFLARYSLYRLADLPPNARSWRPNVLVLSGSPTSRWYLIELANAITQGKSLLTVATVLPNDSGNEAVAPERLESLEQSVRKFLNGKGVQALVEVTTAESVLEGAQGLVRSYGMGPLVPNTVLLGDTEKQENFSRYAELIQLLNRSKRNVLMVRQAAEEEAAPRKTRRKKRIDVWWGRQRENGGLMLVLAYMLQNSSEWRRSRVVLKSLVRNPEEKESALEYLENFLSEGRVHAEVEIFVRGENQEPFEVIRGQSKDADLIFLGMRAPDSEEPVGEYEKYYRGLLAKTDAFPPLMMVLASENLSFEEILL